MLTFRHFSKIAAKMSYSSNYRRNMTKFCENNLLAPKHSYGYGVKLSQKWCEGHSKICHHYFATVMVSITTENY